MMNITESISENSNFLGLSSSRRDRKLVLKKISPAEVCNSIDKLFENSTNYLNTDSNIVIGTNPLATRHSQAELYSSMFGTRLESEDKLSVLTKDNKDKLNKSPSRGVTKSFQKISPISHRRESSAMKGASSSDIPLLNSLNTLQQKDLKNRRRNKFNSIRTELRADNSTSDRHVEYISEKQLLNMLESIKRSSSNTNVNTFLNGMPKYAKDNLMKQEQMLKKIESQEETFNKLSKCIARKVNKIPSELVLGNSGNYRVKKEISELIEYQKPLKEQFGNNSWMMELRRGDNFVGERYVSINVGTDKNPVWGLVKDVSPRRKIDLIRNQSCTNIQGNDFGPYSNNVSTSQNNSLIHQSSYISSALESSNINVKELEELSRLRIDGAKLIDKEIEMAQENPGRKIFYRRNHPNYKPDEVIEVFKEDYNYKEYLLEKIRKHSRLDTVS